MRLLYPTDRPRATDQSDHRTESLLPYYDVPRPRQESRAWLGVCMVSSLDGSTVLGSSSRDLSSPVDQQLLITLRSLADVILVGATTVRRENYGPPRSSPARIAVVSRSGDFDFQLPLWSSGRAMLLLPQDAPEVPVPSIRAGMGEVDLPAAIAQFDANFIHVEGGATLNGALAAADLIDELNLSLSPQIAGGDGVRITTGAPEMTLAMRLAHVLEHDNYLFTRYVRAEN